MGIWEFDTWSTKDLERAVELYDELEDLGLCFVDEDALLEMGSELERRYEKEGENE